MPIEGGAAALVAPRSLRFDYDALVRGSFGLTIFCGAIALVEPSP